MLAGVLRLRADMPEHRVRDILDEARAHGVETGAPLHEEFGRPEDYASRFAPDPVTGLRRKALGFTAPPNEQHSAARP